MFKSWGRGPEILRMRRTNITLPHSAACCAQRTEASADQPSSSRALRAAFGWLLLTLALIGCGSQASWKAVEVAPSYQPPRTVTLKVSQSPPGNEAVTLETRGSVSGELEGVDRHRPTLTAMSGAVSGHPRDPQVRPGWKKVTWPEIGVRRETHTRIQ